MCWYACYCEFILIKDKVLYLLYKDTWDVTKNFKQCWKMTIKIALTLVGFIL